MNIKILLDLQYLNRSVYHLSCGIFYSGHQRGFNSMQAERRYTTPAKIFPGYSNRIVALTRLVGNRPNGLILSKCYSYHGFLCVSFAGVSADIHLLVYRSS